MRKISATLLKLSVQHGKLQKEKKENVEEKGRLKEEERRRRKNAVQERAGDLIKLLAKAEPLRSEACGREDCFVCFTREGGGVKVRRMELAIELCA